LRLLGSRLTGLQIFGLGVWWEPNRGARSGAGESKSRELDEVAEAPPALERCHEKVLLAIARSRDGSLDIEEVARRIRVRKLVAEHYLEFLESLGMVEDVDQDGVFELTAEGRAYLVEERLVR
jgi:predicted transcriptional regulator